MSYRLAPVARSTSLRSIPYLGDQQVVDCISLNDVNSGTSEGSVRSARQRILEENARSHRPIGRSNIQRMLEDLIDVVSGFS